MELGQINDPYAEFTQQNPQLAARVQAAVDRGRAHLEHGHPDEARKEFQRALAIYPHVPAALNNLALLAYGEGDRERARAYLEQLLAFSPAEPTANALMARHWLDEGAVPLAYRYAEAAVQGVITLAGKGVTTDPSRLRRAMEFACQALAGLEDDALLIRLYTETGSPELLPATLVHVAIAFYNRGYFETALQLWQLVVDESPDEAPPRVYLDMAEVIKQHQLLPFRLDHKLDMPQPEKGQRVWLVRVPTLLLAAALTRLYRGDGDDTYEALTLLTSVGLPGFHTVLTELANDITRPLRLRLLAGIQVAATGDYNTAAGVANAIARADLSSDVEALWCLLGAMLAEASGDKAKAAKLASDGETLMQQSGQSLETNPFYQILADLAARVRVGEGAQSVPEPEKVLKVVASTDTVGTSVRLPDAEWLRVAMQKPLVTTLEASLANRPREILVELARRLGEQEPDKMNDTALVRRTAMRMRSLPVERVAGALTTSARQALQWLAQQESSVSLVDLDAWFTKEQSHAHLWVVIEELFRAGLVDIGKKEEARVPLQPQDLQLALPAGLSSRFQAE